MSKIIDTFQKSAQSAAPPLGFRANRTEVPASRLVLIAAVKTPAAAVKPVPGADAVLIRPGKSRLTAKAARAISASLKAIPWGIADTGEKPCAVPAGCDFVVFPATGRTGAAPPDETTGRILEVEPSLDDGPLRAVNDLPVDAVMITDTLEGTSSLVWQQLMIFRHITQLISKPVIVSVPADVSGDDLKSLWEAGIDGILVAADAAETAALHEIILSLPPRTATRKKTDALLPRTGGGDSRADPVPDEEEEEEDWE